MDKKIKKIIPFLTLIILVGIFVLVPIKQTSAQTPGVSQCYTASGNAISLSVIGSSTMCLSPNSWHAYETPPASATPGTCDYGPDGTTDTNSDSSQCTAANGAVGFTPKGSTTEQYFASTSSTPDTSSSGTYNSGNTSLDAYLNNQECIFSHVFSGTIAGCATQLGYGLFVALPGIILGGAAYFFNFLASITLYSNIYSGSTFIPTAWGVVRDLSNIFFILILLYIAVRLILGLGGHDVKQMVGKVIIIALLINFSMFFTEVIIDSSNILALIFYNKMSVTTVTTSTNGGASTTTNTPYQSVGGEKDIAGGMMAAFNPLSLLNKNFFDAMSGVTVPGQSTIPGQTASPWSVVGIMAIAGAIMLFAAYAFFIAGLSFVGRMIELFTLIIFSPFAFMSFTIPKLSGIEDLGWDSWSKNLIRSSFMAPIFMFFMYFIFLLIHANMFETLISNSSTSFWTSLLYVLIPAIFILVLLLKAAKYAKKGSGAFGEYVMKGAQIVGGLAVGAATGGASMLGTATVGRAGNALANSEWAKRREREGKIGSGIIRSGAKGLGSATFDARSIKVGGKSLASATGMNLGEARKGGFTERNKEQIEKRQKRAKELQVGENEPLKQELNKTEMDLQGLLGANAREIESLDKTIEKKRQEMVDAKAELDAGTISQPQYASKVQELTNAKDNKEKFRTGQQYTNSAGAVARAGTATVNIASLEKQQKTQAQAIKTENVKRNQTYANTIQGKGQRALHYALSGGTSTKSVSKEAAHNIVMETKLDSGEKH